MLEHSSMRLRWTILLTVAVAVTTCCTSPLFARSRTLKFSNLENQHSETAVQTRLIPESHVGSAVQDDASNSSFDVTATESTIPGVLLVSLSAGALTTLSSLAIIAFYKRSVRLRLRTDSKPATFTSRAVRDVSMIRSHLREIESKAPPLLLSARSRTKRLATVYLIAGLVCTAALTYAFLLESHAPAAVVVSFTVFSWPVIFCWNQITGEDFRTRRRRELVYVAALLVLGALSYFWNHSNHVYQPLLMFLYVNALPTILITSFPLPAIRPIGPCILCVAVGVFGAVNFVAEHGRASLLLSNWTGRLGLGVAASVLLFVAVSFSVFFALGCLVLRTIVQRYSRNKSSDQSIQVDSIFLLFAVVQAIFICTPTYSSSGRGLYMALSAFPAYWIVRSIGLSWLRRNQAPSGPAPSLLYLRRFRPGRQAEMMFRAITLSWRYIGDVRLGGGTDFARSTIQPHSLLEFLRGHIENSFIYSDSGLKRQLGRLPSKPDPDMRFRITDFLCSEEMWRPAIVTLMKTSEVIFADFRGFTPQNSGSLYEIEQMLLHVPFERVLILTDSVDTEEHVSTAIVSYWRKLPVSSPNHPSKRELPSAILRLNSELNTLSVLTVLFSIACQAGHSDSRAASGAN